LSENPLAPFTEPQEARSMRPVSAILQLMHASKRIIRIDRNPEWEVETKYNPKKTNRIKTTCPEIVHSTGTHMRPKELLSRHQVVLMQSQS